MIRGKATIRKDVFKNMGLYFHLYKDKHRSNIKKPEFITNAKTDLKLFSR